MPVHSHYQTINSTFPSELVLKLGVNRLSCSFSIFLCSCQVRPSPAGDLGTGASGDRVITQPVTATSDEMPESLSEVWEALEHRFTPNWGLSCLPTSHLTSGQL